MIFTEPDALVVFADLASISDDLSTLQTHEDLCDVAFIIGEHRILGVKALLSLRSNALRQLISAAASRKESTSQILVRTHEGGYAMDK